MDSINLAEVFGDEEGWGDDGGIGEVVVATTDRSFEEADARGDEEELGELREEEEESGE